MSELTITPKTKIGELLRAYPHLEEVLIGLSPAFSKLRNPILRRTVANVATLQQVASIGDFKVEDLVNRLRRELGQEELSGESDAAPYLSEPLPEWYSSAVLEDNFDATALINEGGSPMNEIISRSAKLQAGKALELLTPFLPAPVIDILRKKGFSTFSVKEGDRVRTLVYRS